MLMFIPEEMKISVEYKKVILKEAHTFEKYRMLNMGSSLQVPLMFSGIGKELVGTVLETKKIKTIEQHNVPMVLQKVKLRELKRVVYMPVLKILTDMPLYALS